MKESKTTYAYLIEHMQNPSFQKVWDIAYDFVHKLPSELCDELHESLNRGVALEMFTINIELNLIYPRAMVILKAHAR